MTKARSFCRNTWRRNSAHDSCSMVSTRVWLALVSIMMPSVSGWFDSAEKYLMVCGLPSSSTVKSSLARLGISIPCLSFTLKNMLTTLTSALKVCSGSSLAGVCWSWVGADAEGFWDCAAIHALEHRIRHSAAVEWRTRLNSIASLSGWMLPIVVHRAVSETHRTAFAVRATDPQITVIIRYAAKFPLRLYWA